MFLQGVKKGDLILFGNKAGLVLGISTWGMVTFLGLGSSMLV